MQPEDEIRRKLQEKFNNYEPAPNDDSWEKVHASLRLSQMFQDYEAQPQEDSWDKIRASTDLSQRMTEYAPAPEEESWDKIKAGVDLTKKFKDYEVEPQAISWLKIQEAIQSKKRRRGIIIPLFFRIGIAAGLAILVGSLWWLVTKQQDSSLQAIKKSDTSTVAKADIKTSDIAATPKLDDAPIAQQLGEKEINRDSDLSVQSSRSAKSTLPTDKIRSKDLQLANPNKVTGTETIAGGLRDVVSVNTQQNVSANDVSDNTSPVDSVLKLAEMTGKDFRMQNIRKPFDAIAFNAEKPYQEKAQRIHHSMVFNASLMPLQTYQAFTILPQSNTYIQQVGRLDAIDNQRLGVQLRAGAMKPLSSRFATGMSATYTGLQQSVNYEINNGEFEVQTANNGTYTLVGVGEQVSQKQFLQTVGIKLDNAWLMHRGKTSVYALGGAEAVHVLNNKDFGYYVNASIGFSYPVKGGKTLWLEPTFRYSLSQSFDANNYLKMRPYNIGLNFRVNFI